MRRHNTEKIVTEKFSSNLKKSILLESFPFLGTSKKQDGSLQSNDNCPGMGCVKNNNENYK
jgi:hypothetical protein